MKAVLTLFIFLIAAIIAATVLWGRSPVPAPPPSRPASIVSQAPTQEMIGSQAVTITTSSPKSTSASLPPDRPVIQIALLLDTSNSMDGLIEQARSQLWRIVQELSQATYEGKDPVLQVALYSYGNAGYSMRANYIRQDLPFTEDLDAVSQALFGLKTNGGSEYCGAALKAALTSLSWTDRKAALKMMYIAGNESFEQGPEPSLPVIEDANEKAIHIHPVFCGPEHSGAAASWREAAKKSGVDFVTIDQDKQVVHVDAPQDKELVELGQQLNKTYIPLGAKGRAAAENQVAQDANSSRYGSSGVAKRSIAKASKYYRSAGWDLVEAVETGHTELDKVPEAMLPKDMQEMSLPERKEHVQKKQMERAQIRDRIKILSKERDAYVAQERKRLSKDSASSLDEVIVKGVRAKALEGGFKLEETP